MEGAEWIGGEWREEAGRDDVALDDRVAGEQGRGERREHGEPQHPRPDGGPVVAEEAARVAPHRVLGSAQLTSASASRFPSTTSTALTAVAAKTTG